MANPLKLASVWRVISDVDLDGIRRRSHERFEVWIAADDEADAVTVRDLLTDGAPPHPWLRVGVTRAAAHGVADCGGTRHPLPRALACRCRRSQRIAGAGSAGRRRHGR